jgi:hypothetical protein
MSRPTCRGAQALFKVEKEIQETSIFKGRLMLLVSLLLPQILHAAPVWSFDPPSFVISLTEFCVSRLLLQHLSFTRYNS